MLSLSSTIKFNVFPTVVGVAGSASWEPSDDLQTMINHVMSHMSRNSNLITRSTTDVEKCFCKAVEEHLSNPVPTYFDVREEDVEYLCDKGFRVSSAHLHAAAFRDREFLEFIKDNDGMLLLFIKGLDRDPSIIALENLCKQFGVPCLAFIRDETGWINDINEYFDDFIHGQIRRGVTV